MPCFGNSFKLVSKCNKVPNTSELGINHEFPQKYKDSHKAKTYLAGKAKFLVTDIEVYKLEPRNVSEVVWIYIYLNSCDLLYFL